MKLSLLRCEKSWVSHTDLDTSVLFPLHPLLDASFPNHILLFTLPCRCLCLQHVYRPSAASCNLRVCGLFLCAYCIQAGFKQVYVCTVWRISRNASVRSSFILLLVIYFSVVGQKYYLFSRNDAAGHFGLIRNSSLFTKQYIKQMEYIIWISDYNHLLLFHRGFKYIHQVSYISGCIEC